MNIPLEDSYLDILGKAKRGLAVTDENLVIKSGVNSAGITAVYAGEKNDDAIGKIASALELAPDRVVRQANGEYVPAEVKVPEGLACYNTVFEDMTVNSYLVWDPATKEAVMFDTGADASGMLETIASKGLTLKYLLLTHSHGDHVFDLDRVVEKTGVEAWIGDREGFQGANRFPAGKEFTVGSLRIGSRLTWGHAAGGITYVVEGLAAPLAIVGDAVFAGSMGGGMVSYADALKTNIKEIFSLTDNTIICSGHGPLTTVGEQRKNNPFFPNV
ncbi:MAG: MBL fold metallo-hydrolase [Chthoniobacterales bacterium]